MANSSFTKYPDFLTASWRSICGLLPGDFKVFRILLYVKPFNPEDISIKLVGRNLIIKGKHEDHFDKHGFVSREFKRGYVLGEEYEPKSVSSTFGLDGILKVVAYTKVLWKEFIDEEKEMFQGYINLQPFRLKELSFKIEDRIVNFNAKVIPHEFLNRKDYAIEHRYILPLDVIPSSVHASLNSNCMIEIEGEYASQEKLATSKQTDTGVSVDKQSDASSLPAEVRKEGKQTSVKSKADMGLPAIVKKGSQITSVKSKADMSLPAIVKEGQSTSAKSKADMSFPDEVGVDPQTFAMPTAEKLNEFHEEFWPKFSAMLKKKSLLS